MKKYKNLIPILLVVLMVVSILSTIMNAANKKEEYNKTLEEARKAAELGIVEDAASNYQKAMELNSSVDISIELGELYVKQGWISEAASWGEKIVEQFPDEAAGYSFLLEQYIALEDFDECFKLLDVVEARNIKDKEIKNLAEKIEYAYEYGYEFFDDVSIFSGGLCAVMDDDVWGYVDTDGDKVISTQFLWAGAFTTDEIAPIETVNGEYYYISKKGNKKVVVQNLEKCVDLGISVENILPASDNGNYSYYNHDFEKIIDETYTYATAMNGGIAAVCEIDTWYLIDSSGTKIGEIHDAIITDEKGIVFRNDRAFVEDADKVYMVDEEGNKVGKEEFDDAKLFLQADSYAAIKIGNKWGFVDKNGKITIEPQFTDARSFSNGFAAVEQNGFWGFIDKSGKMVIDCRFKDVRDFNDSGNVFVCIDGRWKLLKLIKYNYE